MEIKKRDKVRKISTVIETILITILVVFVVAMMIMINNLQGTARVVNYAGLVRGATQRAVKLEITKNPSDELIKYLDDILQDLKYDEDGKYNLVSLNDVDYQKKLDIQIEFWGHLKQEIEKVRENGYEATDIVQLSEQYFALADQTVSAAENYSEKIAQRISLFEIL